MNSTETQNYIFSHLAGTTQKYISLSELRTLKINVPNKNELDSFNKLVKPMYDNLINNTNENSRLVELRDTLLPKLMSGEIDVSKVNIDSEIQSTAADKLYEPACESKLSAEPYNSSGSFASASKNLPSGLRPSADKLSFSEK